MKYDFRHIDPRTGLPKVIKNNEPEIQMMTRLPWKTGWIYLLQNRISLNTVGNQRYKKKVWYDRRDCTVSTDETKEDAQHIRTAKFPNLGRPAGWIFASEIREFFNLKFTKSLNESKDIKDVKKGERIIFWAEDQLDLDDAWPAVGCMIFDKKGNPSLIGILNPMVHNECCGYISFDMISKWEYVDKVFPKGKTEDRLVQAISDSLVESLFKDDMFDEDEYHVSEKLIEDYVDLDLPSGTLWCKCNVGAKNETDYGNYYQWGETENNVITRNKNTYEKYNFKDSQTELFSEDDIAYQTSECKFVIPTNQLMKELVEYTDNKWVENFKGTGINGLMFKSRTNDNYIFIPAAGYSTESSGSFNYEDRGSIGYIWSSNICRTLPGYAYCMYFYDLNINGSDTYQRYNGFSVRGVLNNKR